MPYIILKTENLSHNIFRFQSDTSIGRHPSSDIVLKGSGKKIISRCHAKIKQDNQGYQLVDCSLNGTRVNNQKIKTHRLHHGDRFHIADYTLTFVEDGIVDTTYQNGLGTEAQFTTEAATKATEEIIRCDSILDDLPDDQLKTQLENQGIILEDQPMLTLFRDVRNVAKINVPVLILGEPGTGKEKVARALHHFSKVKGKFVALNCSAVPENQFESELFGSVKGAFSDAKTKPGKLELANKGTLFLDEISDMNSACQPKLLRFLECRSISRLGETSTRDLDLRIIAATHQDLSKRTETQAFHSDLYQRLACIKLTIPPLRKRKKDILPLAKYFLASYARQYGLDPMAISHQASQIMLSYHWPGNVRELANILLHVYVRSSGDTITADHLASAAEEMEAFGDDTNDAFPSLRELEKIYIQKALK